MAITMITNHNFDQEVGKSSQTVLLDFWAPWCMPCRMLGPIIDQVAEEVGQKVKVGKVNVDEQPELAAKFRVMSIPTLVVMKNGQIISTAVGVKPKQEILKMIS